MDLIFLKRLKTKNNLIIQELKESVNQCDLIIADINETLPYTCRTVDLTNFYHKRKRHVQEEIQEFKVLRDNIKKAIYEQCEHDFTKDLVETNSEETVSIEYCVNCELNKRNS